MMAQGLAAVLDNLAVGDDVFCLFDRECRALDVIGEIRFEGCEIFACDAGRRGVCKLRQRAAVSGSASEFGGIEGFQATRISTYCGPVCPKIEKSANPAAAVLERPTGWFGATPLPLSIRADAIRIGDDAGTRRRQRAKEHANEAVHAQCLLSRRGNASAP